MVEENTMIFNADTSSAIASGRGRPEGTFRSIFALVSFFGPVAAMSTIGVRRSDDASTLLGKPGVMARPDLQMPHALLLVALSRATGLGFIALFRLDRRAELFEVGDVGAGENLSRCRSAFYAKRIVKWTRTALRRSAPTQCC